MEAEGQGWGREEGRGAGHLEKEYYYGGLVGELGEPKVGAGGKGWEREEGGGRREEGGGAGKGIGGTPYLPSFL